MKNIVIRAISGGVYVALIVTSILLFPSTPLLFAALFALLCAIGIKEVLNMGGADSHNALTATLDIVCGLSIFCIMPILNLPFDSSYMPLLRPASLLIIVYFILRPVCQLFIPSLNGMKSLAQSMLALVYVAIPLSLLYLLITPDKEILLAIFVLIWINDTGAYLVGMAIGKHKMFPRLSPKKTWEGLIGGMGFVLITVVVTYYLTTDGQDISKFAWLTGFGLLVSVAATLGDLIESMLKRAAGVKDSGNVIPGHGGVLDRIDSLLFVVPVMVVYLLLTYPGWNL